MTRNDIRVYLNPAMMALYGESSRQQAVALEMLLDTDEWSVGYMRFPEDMEPPISEELRNQLTAIANAGPNAMTIAKIIRIRKGLKT